MERSEVTPATRIMIPAYVAFFAWIGLSNTFTPLHRLLMTPGLRHSHPVVDLRVWGLIFLAIAAALVFAMLWPRSRAARPAAAYVLLVGSIVMVIWMAFLVAAWIFGEATPAAGAYAFLPAIACYATYRSLVWGRR